MSVSQLSRGSGHCCGERSFRRAFYCRQHFASLLATGSRRVLGTRIRGSPDDVVNVAQAADILLQHGPQVWTTPPMVPTEGGPQHGTHQEIQCTLSGLDSVMCLVEDVPDTEDGAAALSSLSADGMEADAGLLAAITKAAILTSPFFFWGTSMVAMKSVLPHTTPLLLGALRLLPAGLMLVGWALATGRGQPATLKAWGWVLAFAMVDAAAFQGFLAEGLAKTSAGLGSVIIDSQPLSVAVLAALLFGERLSAVGVVGLFLGVAGLTLLEVPAESLADAGQLVLSGAWRPELSSIGGPDGLTSSGEFWMLLAAQSMAVGTVMVRYVTRHCDPIMATGWHMIIGGGVLAAMAAQAGDASVAPLASLAAQMSQLTAEDALAMSYVSIMGGALSYGIFFWNASHGSLTSLSSLTFLTPIFASAAGYLALGEVLSPMQLLGGAVTLSAVGCINHRANTRTAQEQASQN